MVADLIPGETAGNVPQPAVGAQQPLREPAAVDTLMEALPPSQRRWCGFPRCECSGCANSTVSRDEWMAWFARRQNARCERCPLAVWRISRDGHTYLACEECPVAWA